MKKKILLGIALFSFLASPNVYAQETETIPETKDIYTHSWRDNWYIQLGAGAQMPFFEKNPGESNFDWTKTTAVYGVSVGHWFSPYFGFRFNGNGGALHYEDFGWRKFNYASLNLDITWDMFNSIGGVNEKRVFSIIPYLGLGTAYAWDFNNPNVPGRNDIMRSDGKQICSHQWALVASLGLEFRFRVHKNIDLYLDARAKGMADNFNNLAYSSGIDPMFSLMGGLSINLGKNGRHVTKYTPYDCSGEIKSLNDKVNALREELAQKDARLRAAESQLPCPEVKEEKVVVKEQPVVAPAIRFAFNSAKISANDKVTLYDVAQVLKANPDAKIVIRGYADKKTGTAAYNLKLSERRANAVKDALVEYGVDEDRMSIEALGVTSQPYTDNNNWNRVVILETK